MSLEDYLADLSSKDRPDRLYAARELRRRVRNASRAAEGRIGTLRSEEARHTLALFDAQLAPKCIELLALHPDLRGPCADILGTLRTDDALPVLLEHAANEERGWVERKLARAAERIKQSQAPDS